MTHKKTFYHPSVLLRMFLTSIIIGLVLYLSISIYMEYLKTNNSYGKELLNETMDLFLITVLSMKVIFPIIVTIKATFDADHYVKYIANFYNSTLSPINRKYKYKYVMIAIFYTLLLFVLFISMMNVIQDTAYAFLWVLILIPLYTLIYQNWIYGLKLTIGKDFEAVYQNSRSLFIKKGILFILLMHIPFVVILQPWFFMSLGDIYYKNRELQIDNKE